MESLSAHLLVANPKLPDGNFYKSVVYLIQHDENGAFGVILNRPTNFQLREVWHAITEQTCAPRQPIYTGGPVDGTLLAVHDQPDCADETIDTGVYLSNQLESLNQLFAVDDAQIRVFKGYSGWGPNQLECEIDAGGWFQTPANVDDLFSDPDQLWQAVAGRIGNRILFAERGGEVGRFDPSLN